MTKDETQILLRVEQKVDNYHSKTDEKFDRIMEEYIIPHNEYIKYEKEKKKNEQTKKNSTLQIKVGIGIAIFTSLVSIFVAFLT